MFVRTLYPTVELLKKITNIRFSVVENCGRYQTTEAVTSPNIKPTDGRQNKLTFNNLLIWIKLTWLPFLNFTFTFPIFPPLLGTNMIKSANLAKFFFYCVWTCPAAKKKKGTGYVFSKWKYFVLPSPLLCSVTRRFAAVELTVLIRLCPSLTSQAVVVFRCRRWT